MVLVMVLVGERGFSIKQRTSSIENTFYREP
jgi:hypothetical protein